MRTSMQKTKFERSLAIYYFIYMLGSLGYMHSWQTRSIMTYTPYTYDDATSFHRVLTSEPPTFQLRIPNHLPRKQLPHFTDTRIYKYIRTTYFGILANPLSKY